MIQIDADVAAFLLKILDQVNFSAANPDLETVAALAVRARKQLEGAG